MGNLVSSARARWEPLRSLGFAAIGAVYAGVGTPFTNPVRIVKVTNLTDQNLIISFNGIDDHDVCPMNGFFLYDVTTNKSESAGLLEISVGDRVYVRAEAALPAAGNIYVTVVYASQV